MTETTTPSAFYSLRDLIRRVRKEAAQLNDAADEAAQAYERKIEALTAERDRLRLREANYREAVASAVAFFDEIEDNDTHAELCRDALAMIPGDS